MWVALKAIPIFQQKYTLTNDIISFEQLGPGYFSPANWWWNLLAHVWATEKGWSHAMGMKTPATPTAARMVRLF